LRERDVEFDVIEYLKNPLSKSDLARILELLPNKPGDLVRNDKKFKELGLNHDDYQTAESVIDLLLEHPVLMQRPIGIKGDRAVISRPAASIEELLS
jgi:arsenate reductase